MSIGNPGKSGSGFGYGSGNVGKIARNGNLGGSPAESKKHIAGSGNFLQSYDKSLTLITETLKQLTSDQTALDTFLKTNGIEEIFGENVRLVILNYDGEMNNIFTTIQAAIDDLISVGYASGNTRGDIYVVGKDTYLVDLIISRPFKLTINFLSGSSLANFGGITCNIGKIASDDITTSYLRIIQPMNNPYNNAKITVDCRNYNGVDNINFELHLIGLHTTTFVESNVNGALPVGRIKTNMYLENLNILGSGGYSINCPKTGYIKKASNVYFGDKIDVYEIIAESTNKNLLQNITFIDDIILNRAVAYGANFIWMNNAKFEKTVFAITSGTAIQLMLDEIGAAYLTKNGDLTNVSFSSITGTEIGFVLECAEADVQNPYDGLIINDSGVLKTYQTATAAWVNLFPIVITDPAVPDPAGQFEGQLGTYTSGANPPVPYIWDVSVPAWINLFPIVITNPAGPTPAGQFEGQLGTYTDGAAAPVLYMWDVSATAWVAV